MSAKKTSEPKLTSIEVQASQGGKVSIIKYDETSDFHHSIKEAWSIPEDWTNEQAEEFRKERLTTIREHVDDIATEELNAREDASVLFRNGNYVG